MLYDSSSALYPAVPELAMLFASRSSVSARERIPLAAVAISESIEVSRLNAYASGGPPRITCKQSCTRGEIHDRSRQECAARHDLVAAQKLLRRIIYLLSVIWRVWHRPCKNLARVPMPLPTSSGLIGLFHPFAANVFADVGSGVSKLNPNQNNAAAEASGQAADDFSELFGASLDSLSGAKTSSIQTSGKLRTNGCVLSNQLKVDSLQTGWSIPSGIPPAAAVDDSDPAVSLAGDLIDADSVKAQMLAGYIESALQSIPATETKNAAKLAPPAETQKPADTQKEDASPAPPPQSDVGATVISIPLPLPVTLLLVAKPAAQTTDALSIAKPGALPATPGAPQV